MAVWKLDQSKDYLEPETKVTSGGGQNYFLVPYAHEGLAMFYRFHGATKYYYLIMSDVQPYGVVPGRIFYVSATSLLGLVSATEADVWLGGRPAAATGAGGADIVARIAQATAVFPVIDNPANLVLGAACGAFGVDPLDISASRDAWWPMPAAAFPSPGVLALPYTGVESWDLVSNFPVGVAMKKSLGGVRIGSRQPPRNVGGF